VNTVRNAWDKMKSAIFLKSCDKMKIRVLDSHLLLSNDYLEMSLAVQSYRSSAWCGVVEEGSRVMHGIQSLDLS
jgi:hypothetical protein